MSRAAARRAVRSQYFFVANDKEAFSVFGRSEVTDINRIRAATDTHCLVLFVIMLGGMLFLDVQAAKHGNVLRLSEPIDFKGKLCGYDEGVEDKPLGYHPNPLNDMIVCVSNCPKEAADGEYTLPDGPMGKFYTRPAYPTAQIFGQQCLPLDLTLARGIISVRSVQSEVYKALGVVFSADSVMLLALMVPLTTSFIYTVMLRRIPSFAYCLAFSTTAVTLGLVGLIMDLDHDVLKSVPLYRDTHPLMLAAQPFFRNFCYIGAVCFVIVLCIAVPSIARTNLVFKECMAAVISQNGLVTLTVSVFFSILRIMFILHVCKTVTLLMSIVSPVEVKLELFGEFHWVQRSAWAPFYLRGVLFYAFGTFWVLEFMSFSNKFVTAQILCYNYFKLRARNAAGQELNHGQRSPVWYALYSLFFFHLGSVAYAALLSFPCRALRSLILVFVPDRPNLQNSLNREHKIAYYLFSFPLPLIQLNLYFLRFFKDSAWVMLPLKGYKYMDAAERVEGLLNRCRGKIPNLTKFSTNIDFFMNVSCGLTAFFWAFFLYREPRHGKYHQVHGLNSDDATAGLFATPQHSPLLALPVLFAFGLWVGSGMLHLVTMSSNALTVCYCIDVEMAGGTETDAQFVSASLKEVYRDLGGGESERELSEMIANRERQ